MLVFRFFSARSSNQSHCYKGSDFVGKLSNNLISLIQFHYSPGNNFQCVIFVFVHASCNVIDFWVLREYLMDRFKDLNNFESDPEEFAKNFCKDMDVQDPEVGVSTANLLHY